MELIITEKPKSALRIAEALADRKPKKESYQGVAYYRVKHDSKEILVGAAVGHLYGLKEKKKQGWVYPIFDLEWKPLYEIDKESKHTKKYISALKKLSSEAKSFTIATDYDVEGEVIGLNILRFICKQKDASRMKFSTLTKPDLVEAYEKKLGHIMWGQAKAGETRHELDWYWGINLSRALTFAIKSTGAFKLMSSGRVQGPTLKLIVDKEIEIKNFNPVPYWLLELVAEGKEGVIHAWHEKGKFLQKSEAEIILEKVRNKDAVVSSIEKNEARQLPPNPFDLTSLQIEAYRCFRFSPSKTLEMAQELYTSGFISYPRTSSQQLPPAIGFKRILTELSKQENFKLLCEELLKKEKLIPRNGKKTDPAHPAIYPTGIVPKKINEKVFKLYSLIVHRFMATFSEPAIREVQNIKIAVNEEKFVAQGIRTTERGWFKFYEPFLRIKEEELPKVSEGEVLKVEDIALHDEETKPPKRYTQASIIKELEKKNLGTKATRAQIIDTLYNRHYAQGTSIEATDLGIKLVNTLETYCPDILDEELTRHFELEMEEIQEDKKEPEQVLAEAKEVLIKILDKFRHQEKSIGKELLEATRETEDKNNTIGKCPKCKDGILMLRQGKYGRFIACTNNPECNTTYSLPKSGFVKNSENLCPQCNFPMILIIRKGKKPQEVCINHDCPSKKAEEIKEEVCPKCNEGKLVLRKSVYGSFIGCSKYPKCRFIRKIEQ